MKKIAFGVVMLLATSVGFSQTPGKEHDTMTALLEEVRQLRQAIEGMTAASQRVQIALSALQIEEAAVIRATQRVDNLRDKCSESERRRQLMAIEVQHQESNPISSTMPERETMQFKLQLTAAKYQLERVTAESQGCQATEAEATSQLRNEQAKLLELQDRINRLDKALEQLSGTAKQ